MAVNYKDPNAPSITDTLSALEVDPNLLADLSEVGITISSGINKVLFKKGGMLLASVPVPVGAVKMAVKGTLGENSINHLCKLIEGKINQLIASDAGENKPFKPAKPDSFWGDDPFPKAKKETAPAKASKPIPMPDFMGVDPAKGPDNGPAPPKATGESACTPQQMKTAPTVPLIQATKLYQPVSATSPGSRYYVVAISEPLKIAARYKAPGLSIRVEGPILVAWSNTLTANGFNMGDLEGKPYASIHFDCPNPLIAQRTIGAIILGLGIQPSTPLPDMEVIANL